MRQFINQFNKDFKQIFFSPGFFLMTGFCCVIWSFRFIRDLFEFASKSGGMQYFDPSVMAQRGVNIYETVFMNHLSSTHLLLLFIIPIITMRLIAEEKKMRTFDLLLTAPITSTKIVLGKFFAAYTVVLILVFLSFLYPFGTSWFAEFNVKLLIGGGYLAIALLAGLYTAIGLFSSALTSSVMLSVSLGVIFIIALHFLGGISLFMSADNPIYSAIANYLAVFGHLGPLFQGNLVSSSIIFFLIAMAFFIFMTQRVVESYRWRVK